MPGGRFDPAEAVRDLKHNLIALPRPDEAQAALAFVQLAITRADIALDAAVVQNVPIASQFDVDGLNHVCARSKFQECVLSGNQERAGQVPADLQGGRTRPAAVAGLFYPADPVRLQTEVLELLGGATPPSKVMPKALIAPHAGYVYSGRVAGAAFAKLRARGQTITRVVLIGPAHYAHVGGIAVSSVDAFETPLGRVLVDTETCSQIDRFEFVTQTDAPHEPEHALEVELPFLQTVLSSFQLVPLVVGDAAPQEVAHLLRQLWDGPETLIVVSSDLSHYHSYETAQRLDLSTAEAIEQGEWVSLGASRACGWVAVAGLLIETRRRGLGVTGSRCATQETRQARAIVSSDMERGCSVRRFSGREPNMTNEHAARVFNLM